MDRYLRNWRQDALNKGQHDAAIYIGDKVHFGNNNYTRALALLSRKDLIHRSLSCRYLATHCYIKQGKYDKALEILGEDNPTHLIATAHNARRKLAHVNGNAARHITHRNNKGQRDRIEYSEERERDREQEKELKFQAGMCYLRGLCFAKRNAFDRAKECYEAAVRIDVQCFEAFDQLMKNSLLSPSEELTFLEELDFETVRVEDHTVAQEAANFTKLLYTTRLSKYASPAVLADATETLSTHYNLSTNPDLLLTRAETLYTQCRFHEALAITTSILNSSNSGSLVDASSANTTASLGHSPNLYPVHLAALYETGSHNTLFHLSHTLSIHAPHEAYTYLAIGTYYLATSRISEARRFFSKASLMDPHSAPAWIGFAHTFAAEGEHDQAIAAYSTAARLFQGNHLPQLFLGMQHLALNNMQLAWEYCIAAFEMSSGAIKKGESRDLDTRLFNNAGHVTGDPLVLNEIGVILYHQSNLPAAAKLFKKSLEVAADLGCSMIAWIATRANLAHALRRLGRFKDALEEFDECLRIVTGGSASTISLDPVGGMSTTFAALTFGSLTGPGPSGAASGYDDRNLLGSIHTSRGLVLLSMMGRAREAVVALHEAVRVLGGDAGGGSVAGTLLSRAMEIWAMEQQDEEDDDHNDDDEDDEDDENQQGNTGNYMNMRTNEQVIGRRLDDDADVILDAALNSMR